MTQIFVVYPPEELVLEFGPSLRGMTGICEISGDMMTTSIIPTEDLAHTIGFSSSVPSVSGMPTLLDYDTELEAYRRIRAEAESMCRLMQAKLPVGYHRLEPLWLGMLEISCEAGLLRLRLSEGLATALGLREGDGLCMGISPDRLTLAFCHDSDGVKLDRALTASFPTGVSLPRQLEISDAVSWCSIAIEVRDHVVFVRVADLVAAFQTEAQKEHDPEEGSFVLESSTCSSDSPPMNAFSRALVWSALWLNAITPLR